MSTIQMTVQLTVESLLAAIEQLPPNELRELKKRLAIEQRRNGHLEAEETSLIEATRESLSTTEKRRLNRLLVKSEQQTLTTSEQEEYLNLARKAEQISVRRVEALAQLSRLRRQPVRQIMDEIGWKGGGDG